MALQPRKRLCIEKKHEKSRFSHEITVSCYVTKKQNHACFTTISKDKSENDIYVNQTKCIGTFGVVFLKLLIHFRAQNPQKLLFLLRHIYARTPKLGSTTILPLFATNLPLIFYHYSATILPLKK